MRVKIISDGTVLGTKVIDVATGQMLENVYSVSWRAATGDTMPEIEIILRKASIEVEGESNVDKC